MLVAGSTTGAPGDMAGETGVVHDLGNLIQIATSAVNLISRSPPFRGETALDPILARARTSLEHAGALVRQTMVRAAVGAVAAKTAPEFVNLASCLAEIQPLMSWACEPDITLRIELTEGLPLVACDRLDLQNALLNLVINARDATPGGGTIIVSARCASETVELEVTDNGLGMDGETLSLAFNPRFTTKAGRGNGFGLAMVKRFAHHAGGRVQIASAPGAGTTVTLRLPSRSTPHR